jgi:hypothetical protein
MARRTNVFAGAVLASLALTPDAGAVELIRFDEAGRDFATTLNRQVDARFDAAFAAMHLRADSMAGLTVTAVTGDSVCFYPPGRSFADDHPGMRAFYRPEENDWCVPRKVLAFHYEPGPAAIPAPKPYGATDTARCRWVWQTGGGFGLWTERCAFETGTWAVEYNAESQTFMLSVNGESPSVVMRAFPLTHGTIEGLLPALAAEGLIPDDGECVFAPAEGLAPKAGRTFFEIVPVGERRRAYEAQPADEVPEPACGDYGMSADGVSFFFTDAAIPGFAFYVNLGQDGTLIDETSIRKL